MDSGTRPRPLLLGRLPRTHAVVKVGTTIALQRAQECGTVPCWPAAELGFSGVPSCCWRQETRCGKSELTPRLRGSARSRRRCAQDPRQVVAELDLQGTRTAGISTETVVRGSG